jgi:cellulose synthase/poly-beta-1,6-N-acetylglucosamine synthase-like glycosyltransferase
MDQERASDGRTIERIEMTAVFWISAALMVYVYVGYSIIARALVRVLDRPVRRGPLTCPITVIVTAYNEEKNIRSKLDNLMALDYPQELTQVLVVSDASTDATDEIVKSYGNPRVELLRIEGRLGKTACQNLAMREARGDVVVFTDATTDLDPIAVRAMVENFNDPEIGCVSGRPMYFNRRESLTGQGGSSYWEYELGIRVVESRLGSQVGATGCLYAVRKSAYKDIDPGLISDFVIALVMRGQELRTVLEPAAICREETLEHPGRELSMRVRVALRSITALVAERRFLNPFKYGLFAWQLWSHKVLRYASPLIWLALLVSSASLSSHWFYAFALLAQLLLLGAGAFAWLLHGREPRILVKPYYFLLTNIASLIAISRFLRGDRVSVWKTVR